MNMPPKIIPLTLLLLAACGGADNTASDSSGGDDASAVTPATDSPVTGGGIAIAVEKAMAGDAAKAAASGVQKRNSTDTTPATGDKNRCVIINAGQTDYSGPCRFRAEANGSFAVDLSSGKPLFGEVVMVQMTIVARSEAKASGLTTAGISSNWGDYLRAKDDRACWQSLDEDSRVCAY